MKWRAPIGCASSAFILGLAALSSCGKVDGTPCVPKSVPTSASAPPEGAFRLEAPNLGVRVTGINYDDNSVAKTIGFDLDGRCTTADSTNVCARQSGADPAEQTDGAQGIDNSFAINVAEAGFELGDDYWSSATITLVSESGRYEVDVVNAYTQFAIPLLGPELVLDASGGGTIAGRIPAEQLIDSVALDGAGDSALCSPSNRFVIAFLVEDAADLLLDGTNAPGTTCDAVSFAMTFSALTPVPVPVLKPGRCAVASDGGVDQ